jgi:membrane protein DedA with SNARE-associated domain
MKRKTFNILLLLGCLIPTCLFIILMGYLMEYSQHELGMRKDLSIIIYWLLSSIGVYLGQTIYNKKRRW